MIAPNESKHTSDETQKIGNEDALENESITCFVIRGNTIELIVENIESMTITNINLRLGVAYEIVLTNCLYFCMLSPIVLRGILRSKSPTAIKVLDWCCRHFTLSTIT